MKRLYDLSIPTGVNTPPWPSYEPLQVKFFKRLSYNGANGQLITTSNHVGTHLDGPLHFVANGGDIASIPLDRLVGPGVVVDLSDMAEDYGIYTPKDIEARVEVRPDDILVISTGYYKYGFDQPEADEERYMLKHPGPTMEFARWCLEKRIKLIAVDCGSADHPMNTRIRDWRPDKAAECDRYLRAKHGKGLSEIFPGDHYQLMHTVLFPRGLIHVENAGGEIGKLLNQRCTIGCFPWKFQGGESAFCRLVAWT